MTKAEIAKFADLITHSRLRTIIFFHESENENGIVGYFDNNSNKELREKNMWNFVRTPIMDDSNKWTLLKGEEIKRISIISV
jgi:hypothetical protein